MLNLIQRLYYAAAALNYVLDNGGYTDCDCLGDMPGWISNPDTQKTDIRDAISFFHLQNTIQ